MIKAIGGMPPFKEYPSDKIPAYRDPFRKLHIHNQEVVKRNKKIEKFIMAKQSEEKNTETIHRQKRDIAEAATKYRLLNII